MRSSRIPIVPIWLVGCLLLIGGVASTGCGQQVGSTDYVWCLFDADDSWEESPFEDVLLVLDRDGSVITQLAQFGGISGIGGQQAIAVLPDGQSAVLVEELTGRVARHTLTGELLWLFERPASSVALLPGGYAYVLTSSGSISGESILLVDLEDGAITGEADYGGLHLAVDELNDAVWIVGDDVKKLSLDLELEFVIDPIEWAALCVDTTTDGSAWVGEAVHSGVEGSALLLLKISPSGELLQSVELKARPYSISVDRSDNSVWVGTSANLLKFDANGNLILSIDERTYSVCVSQEDESVWVAHSRGVIAQYSATGDPLMSLETGLGGYCWISLPRH